MPGVRDRHSGCVCSYLVEHDLFDFLLLSLPDNDWYSHKRGPDAQLHSIAQADLQLARVMNAGGGVERLPGRARDDRHGRPLAGARDRADRAPGRARGARACWARPVSRQRLRGDEPQIAVCPSQRAAMVYALTGPSATRCAPRWSHARSRSRASTWSCGSSATPTSAPRGGAREPGARRAALRARRRGRRSARAQLERRGPARGARRPAAQDGLLRDARLPRRARARLGGAHLPTSGEVLLSAAPGSSSSTGAARRTSAAAATARCTPATRSGRCCSAGSALPRRARPSGRSATSPRSSLEHFGVAPIRVALASGSSETPAGGSALRRARARPARRRAAGSATVSPRPESPQRVALSSTPPVGRTLSAERVLAIASALAKVRDARRGHPGSYGAVYLKGPLRWQVSFFSRSGRRGVRRRCIDRRPQRPGARSSGRGFQVAWTMARGYPGAFGEHVNALYVWLPLCVLFLLPFFDLRRPLSLLHLDLLVLLSLLGLARVLQPRRHLRLGAADLPAAALPAGADARAAAPPRAPARRAPGPLRLLVPAPWLALGGRVPDRLPHRRST